MEFKKAIVNSKIMEVVPVKDFAKNPRLYYDNRTAVEYDDMILPIRKANGSAPGAYVAMQLCGDNIIRYNLPNTEEEKENYRSNQIVDFSNINSTKEMIEKSNSFEEMEREILTSPGNIFKPPIQEDDSPLQKATKTAVSLKETNLDNYKSRFGSNYPNDKREFNKKKISIDKAVNTYNNTDIKATLILEDAHPNVANPMNAIVKVVLTEGGGDVEVTRLRDKEESNYGNESEESNL